jgi:hypothetical protein
MTGITLQFAVQLIVLQVSQEKQQFALARIELN